MDNEKEFLQIINKFIDSITSINLSLGSNRELLASLLQKIDFQKDDNTKMDFLLKSIQKDVADLKEASKKNDDILELFRAYLGKSLSTDKADTSKEDIQLKIEQLKADKEERLEDKKQVTAVKTERWKTIAAFITATVTAVGVTFAAMKTSEKDKKDESKKEEVKKDDKKESTKSVGK